MGCDYFLFGYSCLLWYLPSRTLSLTSFLLLSNYSFWSSFCFVVVWLIVVLSIICSIQNDGSQLVVIIIGFVVFKLICYRLDSLNCNRNNHLKENYVLLHSIVFTLIIVFEFLKVDSIFNTA